MRLHKTFIQAAGGNQLCESRSVEVDSLLDRSQRIKRSLRSDDVTEAETRRENLGECSHCQSTLRSIAADRLRGLAVIPKFSVGVVFQNPEIVFTSFFGEFFTSFFSNRDACRVLESRHDIGKTDAAEFRSD